MPELIFDAVLFDLDGTLTESGPGIMRSAAHAIARMGAPELPEEALRAFVGPPLLDSFRRYAGFSEEEALRAVELYRERYHELGWRENRVYTGIPALFRALKAQGKKILLASSKPEHLCLGILRHFGLMPMMDGVFAIQPDEHHAEKAEVVARALRSLPENARAVMVGDRKFDVEGAHANGLKAIGVAYGYGSRQELEAAGADIVADDVAALSKALGVPAGRGVFLSFEGADGSGKSTQLKFARAYLEERGYDVCLTREPGGTPISEQIRAILLNPDSAGMTPETEALLFAAARMQCVRDVMLPALAAGKVLIADRYVDSSFAYQAAGRELGEAFIRQINARAMDACMPDYTLWYRLRPERAESRLKRDGAMDRIEAERGAFPQRVEAAYQALAEREPGRIVPIDADGSVEEVSQATAAALNEIFGLSADDSAIHKEWK